MTMNIFGRVFFVASLGGALALGWALRGRPVEPDVTSPGSRVVNAEVELSAAQRAELRRSVQEAVREELRRSASPAAEVPDCLAPVASEDEGAATAASDAPEVDVEKQKRVASMHEHVDEAIRRGRWSADDAQQLLGLGGSVPRAEFSAATLRLVQAINRDELRLETAGLLF